LQLPDDGRVQSGDEAPSGLSAGAEGAAAGV